MVIPFSSVFMDRISGSTNNPELTRMHTIYFDAVNHFLFRDGSSGSMQKDVRTSVDEDCCNVGVEKNGNDI